MCEKKNLHELTNKELGNLFPIIIEKYNSNWAIYFENEKKEILKLFLKLEIISIDHIGSTAIPGIKAKPTIDILIQINDNTNTDTIIKKIKSLNYQFIKRLDNPPPYMMFVKGYSNTGFVGQVFHIHVRFKKDWNELYFRDFLRKNEIYAKEYEDLKIKLAKKHKNDREKYTEAKTSFIEKINELAKQ